MKKAYKLLKLATKKWPPPEDACHTFAIGTHAGEAFSLALMRPDDVCHYFSIYKSDLHRSAKAIIADIERIMS